MVGFNNDAPYFSGSDMGERRRGVQVYLFAVDERFSML
jgi:hypothetical protein